MNQLYKLPFNNTLTVTIHRMNNTGFGFHVNLSDGFHRMFKLYVGIFSYNLNITWYKERKWDEYISRFHR